MTAPKRGVGFFFGCFLVHPLSWGVKCDKEKFGLMVHLGPLLLSLALEAGEHDIEPDHHGDPDAPIELRGAGDAYAAIHFYPGKRETGIS